MKKFFNLGALFLVLFFVFIYVVVEILGGVVERRWEDYCQIQENSLKIVCKDDCQRKGLEENCYYYYIEK